jgi:acyl-CoA reductase-like NAD-dependent aldehyde dehydrogenase
MDSVNPATGERIHTYDEHTPAAVAQILDGAVRAAQVWREQPLAARGARLKATAHVLRRRAPEFARLMTLEMGKPIAAAEGEVEKCAWACEHFADHAADYLAPRPVESDARSSYVRYDPLGVVLAVMPWNFPFWQVIRCAAPALMAGNAVVLKHASNVPGCALAIAEAFEQAGLPPGTFATLLVPSSRAGELVTDSRIAAVSVTGSEPTGAAVAAAAGRSLKKTVLELGGSDAFVVLADADPERTAAEAAAARCINNGESCIAAKRFIVDAALADDFTRHLKSAMAAMTVGDPLDRATQIGPLARPDLVDVIEDQVARSVQMGARVITGGRRLERPGCFFPPTVLTDVVPGMPAFDEETFGPVAPVIRARDAAHAVELANRSRFGLGASIWTADPSRGEALAARIEAGSIFINGAVKSDPRLPFGGVKASGYGRELSAEGIREFTNVKTVWRR